MDLNFAEVYGKPVASRPLRMGWLSTNQFVIYSLIFKKNIHNIRVTHCTICSYYFSTEIAQSGAACDVSVGPICDPKVQTASQGFGGLICASNVCECDDSTTSVKAYTYFGYSMTICAHASGK